MKNTAIYNSIIPVISDNVQRDNGDTNKITKTNVFLIFKFDVLMHY